MSLKSWKKEFYPVPASEVAEKDALAHSLRKWEGLQAKHLKRHAVALEGMDLVAAKRTAWRVLGWRSCALCAIVGMDCSQCVLEQVRPGRGCANGESPRNESPYEKAIDTGDVRPMLALLRKAMRAQAKKVKP